MAAERRAYFRRHQSATARRRFVERQQSKLRALRRAAACRVQVPAPQDPTLPPQAGAPCSPSLAPNAQALQFEPVLGVPMFNEGPLNPLGSLPATRSVDAVVIPVDFSDAPASEDAAQVAAQITAELSWFAEVSHGRFTVSATVLPRWYRLPSTAGSYPEWHSREGGHRLLTDATAGADADVDFSRHAFVFVLVPPSFPQSGNPAWSVFPGLGVARDGVELRHATFMTSRGPYVANHELTHSLGLPDLYLLNEATRQADFTLVGEWDPMSVPGPRHLLGWHKWRLGWIGADQIACLGAPGSLDAHLTPAAQAGGVKLVVVQTAPSTAYLIEARASAGRERLCKEGVLVYTVDSQVRNGQGPVRVLPHRPDGVPGSCGLLHEAPYPVGAVFQDASLRVEVLRPSRAGVVSVRVTRT